MSRRTIIIISAAAILAGTLAIALYYRHQGLSYVSTDDARVAADVVAVTPEIPGAIISWQAAEGDVVQAGQVLGRQDLGVSLTSGGLSPQTIGTVGSVIAEKALIRAPISGQIIMNNAVVGEMASPGVVLAMVGDVDHLYVSANIKEGDIMHVKVGQAVDVRVDAAPHRVFAGKVESIGRATTSTFSLLPAQNNSGNYTKVTQVVPIKIQLPGASDARLMIGMNSTVRIHIR